MIWSQRPELRRNLAWLSCILLVPSMLAGLAGCAGCPPGSCPVSGSGSGAPGPAPAPEFVVTGSMTTGRFQHTATRLNNGMVLIAGGLPEFNGTATASAELYDPATGKFTATGSLNTPREGHTATLLNDGTVLITGGADNTGNLTASAELYDPATGEFTFTGSMNAPRGDDTATLLNNGMVLIAGGQTTGGAQLPTPSSTMRGPRHSASPETSTCRACITPRRFSTMGWR